MHNEIIFDDGEITPIIHNAMTAANGNVDKAADALTDVFNKSVVMRIMNGEGLRKTDRRYLRRQFLNMCKLYRNTIGPHDRIHTVRRYVAGTA